MNVKQVILMRNDLNMRKGKMVAMGAHSTMKVLMENMSKKNRPFAVLSDNNTKLDMMSGIENILTYAEGSYWDLWLNGIFTKICLQVDSEADLDKYYNQALLAGMPCAMIEDNGLTEFKGIKTKTCCAIGPFWSEEIDKITGNLKLY